MKHLSLNKYLKLTLTLSVIVAYVLVLFGGWATHRQETFNEQYFGDEKHLVNGLGVLVLIVGWGFWEFFASARSPKNWAAFVGIGLTLVGMIMINGIFGIIGGSLAVVLTGVIFFLVQQSTSSKGAK